MKLKQAPRIKRRRRWAINPRTRIKESAKAYSRNRAGKELKIRIGEEL